MKELWIETGKDDEKEALRSLVDQYADVIVEGNKATFLANKETLQVIAPFGEGEIDKVKAEKKVLRICIKDRKQRT